MTDRADDRMTPDVVRQAGAEPGRVSIRTGFRVGQYPKLSETFVQSQISGMAERGHVVSVLADELLPPDERRALPRRLSAVRPKSALPGKALDALPWRVRRFWTSTIERRWARDIDVAVCNFGWFGAQLAHALGGDPKGARFVTIFHGDDVSRSLQQGNERIYDELFERCDLMLAVSDLWRSRLISLGAPPEKVRVYRMGVDLGQHPFAPKPRHQPVRRILHVGRLVEKKGTAFLLQALALARREMAERPLTLEIIGEGPLDESLRGLAKALGVSDIVSFLGPLPHDVVRARLAEAELFILPSVTAADGDMEGIPVALMEAMAAGVPVISTYHSGIPELIDHGKSGLLAAERDPDDLFRQIRIMAEDADARLAMTAGARRTIEEHFDNARLQDELASLLVDLVERRNASG